MQISQLTRYTGQSLSASQCIYSNEQSLQLAAFLWIGSTISDPPCRVHKVDGRHRRDNKNPVANFSMEAWFHWQDNYLQLEISSFPLGFSFVVYIMECGDVAKIPCRNYRIRIGGETSAPKRDSFLNKKDKEIILYTSYVSATGAMEIIFIGSMSGWCNLTGDLWNSLHHFS